MERIPAVASPYSVSATVGAVPRPGDDMQLELVERARRGDHDAFAALAGAAIGRLDGAARLILRDPDQAKDAVQEALVRAWRDLPTLRDPARFDAWLHRLLVRSCIDEARRLRRHRFDVELSPLHAPAVGDGVSLTDDRDQLERGFSRLPPEDRALIVLHHDLDLPMPEVARALGIPLGTAKSRLHRALQVMRAALDADARTAPSDREVVA
jgi:RNA polymerase sigma factor (sigma-70 family)